MQNSVSFTNGSQVTFETHIYGQSNALRFIQLVGPFQFLGNGGANRPSVMALASKSITVIHSVLKQSEDERGGSCELSHLCWYTLTYRMAVGEEEQLHAVTERHMYRLCGPVLIPPTGVSPP